MNWPRDMLWIHLETIEIKILHHQRISIICVLKKKIMSKI